MLQEADARATFDNARELEALRERFGDKWQKNGATNGNTNGVKH